MGEEEARVENWCVVLLFGGIYGFKVVIPGENTNVETVVDVGV